MDSNILSLEFSRPVCDVIILRLHPVDLLGITVIIDACLITVTVKTCHLNVSCQSSYINQWELFEEWKAHPPCVNMGESS